MLVKKDKIKNKNSSQIIFLFLLFSFLTASILAIIFFANNYILGIMLLVAAFSLLGSVLNRWLFFIGKIVNSKCYKRRGGSLKKKSFKQRILWFKRGNSKRKKKVKKRSWKDNQKEIVVLPLYFGWEIVIRKVKDLRKHIVGPFKDYWQYLSAVGILILFVSVVLVINNSGYTKAATYSFIQESWAGDASTTTAAVHTSDQTGWTGYASKDSSLMAGDDLTLTSLDGSYNDSSSISSSLGSFTNTIGGGGISLDLDGEIIAEMFTYNARVFVISNQGNLYAWGNNGGHLGNNSTANSKQPIRPLKGEAAEGDYDGSYLSNIREVFPNGTVYALSNQDNIYCWGYNYGGQLGNDSTTNSIIPVRPLKGEAAEGDYDGDHLSNIEKVYSDGATVCALSNQDNIYCWGYNSRGLLGNNTLTDSLVPIRPLKGEAADGDYDGDYLSNIESVIFKYNTVCAVSKQGNVYCWGSGSYGVLGSGSTASSYTPKRVLKGEAVEGDYDGEYLSNIRLVIRDNFTTCALSNQDNLYCWGQNSYGQLGNNSTTSSSIPVRPLKGEAVEGDYDGDYLDNVNNIILYKYAACVSSKQNNVYCWGQNSYGQLGNNSTTSSSIPVRPLKGEAVEGDYDGDYLSNIDNFSMFNYTVCSLSNNNNIYCWGQNSYGQLGNNSDVDSFVPVRPLKGEAVEGDYDGDYLDNVKDFITSFHSSYVLSNQGNLYSWGFNSQYYQLGDGTNTNRTTPVRPVKGDALEGDYDGDYLAFLVDYYSSGNYTSEAIDMGGNVASWSSFDWDTTMTANTQIILKAKTGSTSNITGVGDCTALATITSANASSTVSLSGNDCITAGHRYIKYYLEMSTLDVSETPRWNMGIINYNYYSTSSIISSKYDTSDDVNLMGDFSWQQDSSLPSGSGVTVALRATSTFELLDTTDWVEVASSSASGFLTSGCTDTSGEVICDNSILPSAMRDGVGDRWFQYKITLGSEGSTYPTVSSFSLDYVVNSPPEVQNVAANANIGSDLINISYEVRDTDTDSGSFTPGYITPSFQYSADSGVSWHNITTGLSANATTTKEVESINYSSYSVTWNAAEQNINAYSSQFLIKVIVDDGESANNTDSDISAAFEFDGKNPTLGSDPITVIASTTPANIIFATTDDTDLEMQVSLSSDFSGASWVSYNATTTISLATDPDTVYARFRDEYGNITSTSAVTPETSSYMVIRDVTNLDTNDYQLFIAWKAVVEPSPGFQYYNIWYSTDGSVYTLLTSIDDRTRNYYMHTGLDSANTYYYKVVTQDDNNNTSYFSSVISDVPDGQGGTDTTPPTISNVSVSATTTQSVTIVWDTDELSNSTVGYSTTASNFDTEVGVATMADTSNGVGQHSVTITGLTPNTTYYYQVKSIDPDSNTVTDNNGGDGYSFATAPGPVISNVSASTITNTGGVVTWNTDINSNSTVVYSLNSDLSAPTEIHGSTNLVTDHLVNISDLSQGNKYYYYVKSTDNESNEAIDNNGGDYYNFTTTNDTTAPTISSIDSSVVMDTQAVITWSTDELATSHVDYGTESGNLTSTSTDSSLNTSHSITLTGLTADRKYYYQLTSVDASSNSTSTLEYSFTTLENLSEESDVVAREATARSEGETTGRESTSGGGGMLIIDKTDKTSPNIDNIKISRLGSDSATITWSTDEEANSFIEYGFLSNEYIHTYGKYDSSLSHSVVLPYLLPQTTYYFKILSSDSSGNLSRSTQKKFTTVTEEEALLNQNQEYTPEEEAVSTIEALAQAAKGTQENVLINTVKKAAEIISNASGQVSLSALETALTTQFESLNELSRLVPPPILGGEPSVITTAKTATVAWRTDKDANSIVALAPEGSFASASDNELAPYIQLVGKPESLTTAHVVEIYDLEPDTLYHYQVRSKSPISGETKSKDFTFRTRNETLEISSHAIERISTEEVVFKWVTNIETDTKLTYIPYRNNVLAVEDAMDKTNDLMSVMHEIRLDNLEAGVIYDIELSGTDVNGNIATRKIPAFSTADDNLPPIISQVQTDSAISPGKDIKTQTIISWVTNEPTSSRVYYQDGIAGPNDDLAESTQLDQNFTRKHVVVLTKFDPGKVYSFKVESIDSTGNVSISKLYTILTPRQKESVFQVIMNNFEDIFGWVGEMKR